MGAPALLDAQADAVLERLNAAVDYIQNHVTGGVISDGGTTQGSGAGTALNFDVDTTVIAGMVKGRPISQAAGTDVDSDAGISFGATSGKSVVYTLVSHTAADGVTAAAFVAIPGDVADTGEEVAPTLDEIAEVLTHENFVIVGDITVNRTADTTVTMSISYLRRFADGSRYNTDLATTEAGFRG